MQLKFEAKYNLLELIKDINFDTFKNPFDHFI